MKKKICLLLLILIVMLNCIYINSSYAGEIVDILEPSMSSVSTPDPGGDSGSGIPGAINSVIGLLQFVGSGIALIVITILGIKYILASPSDKADVKKSIFPILIGCVLLFGGVNIAAAIASFSDTLGTN